MAKSQWQHDVYGGYDRKISPKGGVFFSSIASKLIQRNVPCNKQVC